MSVCVGCILTRLLHRLRDTNTGESGDNCKACDELVKKSRRKFMRSDKSELIDSAKTRAVMSLLNDIDERSERSEKTIVFSQFTSMLDLLQPFLQEAGIRFVRCEWTSYEIVVS